MSTYNINAVLTSYYGTNNTLSRSSAGVGGTHSFTLGGVTYTGYFSGYAGSDTKRYGTLATFPGLSSIDSNVVTSVKVIVTRSHETYTNPTYSVAGYYSVPTQEITTQIRTGYSEITTNRASVTFTGTPSTTEDGTLEYTLDVSKFDQLKNYGFIAFFRSSGTTYRQIRITNIAVIVETDEQEYTLSYNANGGSNAPSSQTASGSGSVSFTISSTTPTRTGHTFQGWALTSSATTASYQAGGTISISSDVTLYAVWKANTYTVTYNANGGTGAPASQTKTYGTDLVLSLTAPTRTGYEYTIWNTAADGSGTSYVPGDIYSANANLTLYAQWVVTTYNIHYEGNGGSGVPADQVKTYNVATTISSVTPTRAGYTFGGWNTSADGSGTNYASGATYSTNANLTLYAKWSVAGVTVSFNANGGTCSEASRTVYPGSAYGTLPVPSWENHTFDGWFTSASGGDQVTASTIVTNGSAHTLFAHWTAAPSPGRHYAVAYYKHNGQMKTVRVYIKNNGEMKVGNLYSL